MGCPFKLETEELNCYPKIGEAFEEEADNMHLVENMPKAFEEDVVDCISR